jgi:spore photoproduct lyase
LTKADDVDRLLPLTHNGHTTLSWSVNPQRVIDEFEANTPPLVRRIQAMKACAAQGYPVRAVVMPVVPIPDWKAEYESFVRLLLHEVPLRRLTLAGICSYPHARSLMENALGPDNDISRHLAATGASRDGRVRYPQPLRIAMYSHVIAVARDINPSLDIALCLEEARVWATVGLEDQLGKCNCVL